MLRKGYATGTSFAEFPNVQQANSYIEEYAGFPNSFHELAHACG